MIARRCLIWLAFAQQPLSLRELTEAAVLDQKPFDPEERLIHPSFVVELLGSLVDISYKICNRPPEVLDDSDASSVMNNVRDESSEGTSDYADDYMSEAWQGEDDPDPESSGIIRLAHYSVEEYLVSSRIGHGPASLFALSDVLAHQFIAESCLRYIEFYDQTAFPKPLNEDDAKDKVPEYRHTFPLLKYACHYWPIHTKFIPVEAQRSMDRFFLKMFHPQHGLLSSTNLLAITYAMSDDYPWWIQPSLTIGQPLPLHFAVILGLVGVVQRLVELSPNVNETDTRWRTALDLAIYEEEEEIVDILLHHGFDVNVEDEDGDTPLHKASDHGSETIVQLLLKHGAKVSAIGFCVQTALHKAVYKENANIVRLLLEHGTEVSFADDELQTPLHLAVDQGNAEITALLLKHGAEVSLANDDLRTPLHLAVRKENANIVRLLLEHGAEVSFADTGLRTPLHLAALWGNAEMVGLLLEHGASVASTDDVLKTPLHHAARNKSNTEVIGLLLKHGADVLVADKFLQTPLHLAAAVEGNAAAVQLLLEHEADVNAQHPLGSTALHESSRRPNSPAKIRALLQNRANIDARDKTWQIPLHRAIRSEPCFHDPSAEISRLLLDYGADVMAKDANGNTPLHLASFHKILVQLLLEYGADASAKNDRGMTPLQFVPDNDVKQLLQERIDTASRGVDMHTLEKEQRERRKAEIKKCMEEVGPPKKMPSQQKMSQTISWFLAD